MPAPGSPRLVPNLASRISTPTQTTTQTNTQTTQTTQTTKRPSGSMPKIATATSYNSRLAMDSSQAFDMAQLIPSSMTRWRSKNCLPPIMSKHARFVKRRMGSKRSSVRSWISTLNPISPNAHPALSTWIIPRLPLLLPITRGFNPTVAFFLMEYASVWQWALSSTIFFRAWMIPYHWT